MRRFRSRLRRAISRHDVAEQYAGHGLSHIWRCVLSVIAEHETYGYEILQRLTESGFTELGEGTMYPVLTRLEKNGYIQCRKEKSPLGPIRKYYSVTDAGTTHLKEFCESYKSITESAKKILKMEE